MDTVARTKLLAKDEMRAALIKLQSIARDALPEGTFGQREEATLAIFEEAARGVLLQELGAIEKGLGERVLVDGVEYKEHEPGMGRYSSLNGPLDVPRRTYREVGVRNGPTIVPLELVAGLVEGATPAMAYNVANGYARLDMRQHGEALELAHRIPPPRATLERMAKRIAEKVHEAAPRVEAALRRSEKLPEDARGVVMGLDRTSVPMAEERPEGASPEPKRRRRTPRVRVAPTPIDVNYRMAYVGTVSIVDEQGEALITRRYAAPASDDPAALVASMTADVAAAVKRQPGLGVGCMQDGAPEMWNLTREGLSGLQSRGLIANWEEGIDRYHLLQRLGKALDIIEPSPAQRTRRLSNWNVLLDVCDSGIDSIEQELNSANLALPREKQATLAEHITYVANNKDRMRYVTLAETCLPIGSGVTESAAKTVIGQRANTSGQRWGEPGLRGALTLRAIHHSDRLPRFWKRFSDRYTAVVQEAA
jgi:hypothetical protein